MITTKGVDLRMNGASFRTNHLQKKCCKNGVKSRNFGANFIILGAEYYLVYF